MTDAVRRGLEHIVVARGGTVGESPIAPDVRDALSWIERQLEKPAPRRRAR